MAEARANLVDRLIGWASPQRGLRRLHARELLTRAYEAGSARDGWRPRRSGASGNADHAGDASRIRAKARALYQNVPIIRSGIEARVQYTIGTGVLPRCIGGTADANRKLDELLARWFRVADVEGRTFEAAQAVIERALEVDGEVLIRLRPRRPEDGLPIPLQFQLLEIDWLDSSKTGINGGNTIVNGIEYDPLGRVVNYWLWDQHPGDLVLRGGTRAQSRPVAARWIIHRYAADRPGLGRGFSRLATVISSSRDLQTYMDAELARKNLETRYGVLYSGDPAALANPAAVPSISPAGVADGGELLSGQMQVLPAGSSVTVAQPTVAGGYVEYVKLHQHMICAGMDVPYEMATGDMTEVNSSSARVRLLQFRASCEQQRWSYTIPQALEPIVRAALDYARLAGEDTRAGAKLDWSAPKWGYINPLHDAQADAAEIATGLSSLSEKLRQRGLVPDLVYAEIKQDIERLRADGVLDVLMALQKARAPEAGQGDNATANAGGSRA